METDFFCKPYLCFFYCKQLSCHPATSTPVEKPPKNWEQSRWRGLLHVTRSITTVANNTPEYTFILRKCKRHLRWEARRNAVMYRSYKSLIESVILSRLLGCICMRVVDGDAHRVVFLFIKTTRNSFRICSFLKESWPLTSWQRTWQIHVEECAKQHSKSFIVSVCGLMVRHSRVPCQASESRFSVNTDLTRQINLWEKKRREQKKLSFLMFTPAACPD